jgi:nicotinamide riboside transporter PnuC
VIWSFTLAGLGVISLILTGRKQKSGWIVGLINSGLWVIYALTTNQPGFLISSAVFITVQARNYIAWAKADKANE